MCAARHRQPSLQKPKRSLFFVVLSVSLLLLSSHLKFAPNIRRCGYANGSTERRVPSTHQSWIRKSQNVCIKLEVGNQIIRSASGWGTWRGGIYTKFLLHTEVTGTPSSSDEESPVIYICVHTITLTYNNPASRLQSESIFRLSQRRRGVSPADGVLNARPVRFYGGQTSGTKEKLTSELQRYVIHLSHQAA